jgi:hypothetical protein
MPVAMMSVPAIEVSRPRRGSLADTYLGRVWLFRERVAQLGLEPVDWFDRFDPGGALILTVHGSLAWVGAPLPSQARPFSYYPLRPGRLGPLQGAGRIASHLRSGASARIGVLRLSRIALLARDPLGPRLLGVPEQPPPEARMPEASFIAPPLGAPAPERSAASLVLASYGAKLDLLANREIEPVDRMVLECETLADALFLQQALARTAGEWALEQVTELVSAGRTRYQVDHRDGRERGVEIIRSPEHGPATCFQRVRIDPQRIVPGAPLLLFARDPKTNEESVACFTRPIVTVVPR